MSSTTVQVVEQRHVQLYLFTIFGQPVSLLLNPSDLFASTLHSSVFVLALGEEKKQTTAVFVYFLTWKADEKISTTFSITTNLDANSSTLGKSTKKLHGCSGEKPTWMLATSSYTFIAYIASYYTMVFSSPPQETNKHTCMLPKIKDLGLLSTKDNR